MLIKVGWWNTSLSPPKGRKPTIKDRKFAVRIVGDLLAGGVDLLGLCEVSIDDVKEFENEFGKDGFAIRYAFDRIGRAAFDMALIYRMSTVDCLGSSPWSVLFGKNTFKSGYHLDLSIGGDRMALIICHWPARRFYPAESPNRRTVAADVRSKIDRIINGGVDNIIVMGDFNDEPFNSNLSHELGALRDRASASSHKELLYNPFWNFIGCRPLFNGGIAESLSGTHYYRLNHRECWWTFDQIMFSSSFLGSGTWSLNEEMILLYDDETLITEIKGKGRFDHFPVISAIQKAG